MDAKKIQLRMRRTKQAHRFPWHNPSAVLRRALRELIAVAEQLKLELAKAKHAEKQVLKSAKLVPHWQGRVATLMKQLTAGLPVVAKGGAPRSVDGMVARVFREFPRAKGMPVAMHRAFIRLQQVDRYVVSTKQWDKSNQLGLAQAEQALKASAARWDTAWKALCAEAKRQNPTDKRVAKLIA